eukprot:9101753-Pyramimonas_sp.AAC.1
MLPLLLYQSTTTISTAAGNMVLLSSGCTRMRQPCGNIPSLEPTTTTTTTASIRFLDYNSTALLHSSTPLLLQHYHASVTVRGYYCRTR